MADINLQCGQCEATFQVSEYVDAQVIPCPKCGSEIAIPREGDVAAGRSRLKLKAKEQAPEAPSSSHSPATTIPITQGKSEKSLAVKKGGAAQPNPLAKPPLRKKKGRKQKNPAPAVRAVTSATSALGPEDRQINKSLVKDRRPKPIWEWLTILVIGGGGLFLMWKIHGGHAGMGRIYFPARLIIIPIIYLWVVYSAFKESYMPGFFALLFPPYTIYFGISRTDFRILRGAMAGLLVCLIAEMHFIPEKSFLSKVEAVKKQFVGKGKGALKSAQ